MVVEIIFNDQISTKERGRPGARTIDHLIRSQTRSRLR